MLNSGQQNDNVISIEFLDRLAHNLNEEGLVTQENIRIAKEKAQQANKPLYKALVKLGYISEEKITTFMGNKLGIPFVNIRNYTIDSEMLDLVPEKVARRYKILPLFKIEKILTVAISDPLDINFLDDIAAVTGCKVEPVIASPGSVQAAIEQWYGMGAIRQQLIDELIEDCKEIAGEEDKGQRFRETAEVRLRNEAEEIPIIRLVNSYIVQAFLEGASDIHLQPKKNAVQVRFRIDGIMYEKFPIPTALAQKVAARIKVMARMDITVKKIPQDGRIGFVIRDKHVDIRISTLPSMFGENIVLRLLDQSKGIPTLSELGFYGEDLRLFKSIITASSGMIIASGPTGSGKTTTIYSAISALNKVSKNIMTLEDPIEYMIGGIVQSQVDSIAKGSFAGFLKAILRQDPDIIYVGEMRDYETAEVATRAALTGHLVFSTLHTNNAIGSIMRLSDMGIDPGLLASVLNCCFAQRLVRRICTKCITEYQPDESLLARFRVRPGTRLHKGRGCDSCRGTGYKGRIGVYEILTTNNEIKGLIETKAPENVIVKAAKAHGMRTFLEDGLRKVTDGLTTLEEISTTIPVRS